MATCRCGIASSGFPGMPGVASMRFVAYSAMSLWSWPSSVIVLEQVVRIIERPEVGFGRREPTKANVMPAATAKKRRYATVQPYPKTVGVVKCVCY